MKNIAYLCDYHAEVADGNGNCPFFQLSTRKIAEIVGQ